MTYIGKQNVQAKKVSGCFGAVGVPVRVINLLRFGPILLKTLQFSSGTFSQIHSDIHSSRAAGSKGKSRPVRLEMEVQLINDFK